MNNVIHRRCNVLGCSTIASYGIDEIDLALVSTGENLAGFQTHFFGIGIKSTMPLASYGIDVANTKKAI
jgi:hypothetical protein